MASATDIAGIREMVRDSIMGKPVDKMIGHPTLSTHKHLVNQLAQAAGDIETVAWGGNHGCIALVLEDAQYQTLTGDPTSNTDWQDVPDNVHPDIDETCSEFELLTLQAEQKQTIAEYHKQIAVDNTLKKCLLKSIDEQYVEELKKDYIGYADESTKSILSHIKTTWCKVTTQEKKQAKAQLKEPWDQVMHIKTYARRLNKDQALSIEVGVGCGNTEKVQIFVEQMYECAMFNERELIEWEDEPDADKTWTAAQKYFGDLYVKKRSYQEDMKSTKGEYESASSFGDSSRRVSGANSISERTASTTASRSTLPSTTEPPNEWVQYTDSLEDSLVEAKEYAAAISSKNDNQAEILAELKEQREQTKLALEQNKKLMELLAKGMMISATDKADSRPGRQKRKCGNCGKMGVHEDDACFSLEKNKDKWPQWYK